MVSRFLKKRQNLLYAIGVLIALVAACLLLEATFEGTGYIFGCIFAGILAGLAIASLPPQ